MGLFSLFFFVFTQNRLVRIFGNNANSFVQVTCTLISNFHDKIIINILTCTNELRPSQPPLNLLTGIKLKGDGCCHPPVVALIGN